MKTLLTLSAVIAMTVAVAFTSANIAIAKNAPAPRGWEGMPRACWPGGSKNGSLYCCMARGDLNGYDRNNRLRWCKKDGAR